MLLPHSNEGQGLILRLDAYLYVGSQHDAPLTVSDSSSNKKKMERSSEQKEAGRFQR